MDLSDVLRCDPQSVDPFYVSQENFFDHLFCVLRRLEIFFDSFLVLNNHEIVSSNHFVLSALSKVAQALPKGRRTGSYFVVRDAESWTVRWLVDYFYSGKLTLPRNTFESMNKVLASLEVELLGDFFESEELLHFSMNQQQKCEVLNTIWASRHKTYDVKIITRDENEVFAHWAILAASSEELYTLFQAPLSVRPSLVALLEFEAADVELLLQFCYKGEVQIPRARATNLCRLAKMFGIKDLFNTIAELGYHRERQPVVKQGTTRLSCYEHKDTSKRLLFKSLFDRETLSDLQLISNDHTFKVHSAILSVSPYFQPIFNQPDWRHCLIFLSSFALESVQAFVDLVYYGEVIYQGGVQDFISVMEGLIDFTLLPINSVENLEPPINTLEKVPQPKANSEPPALAPVDVTHESSKLLTYQCEFCPNVFYSRKRLKNHLSNDHPLSKLKCEQCGLLFDTQTDLKTHLKEAKHRAGSLNPFFCPTCGKSFSLSCSLRKHMRLHDSSLPLFECDICQRTCSRKDYLEEHMRTHTGKKPYKCSFCGKRFVGKTGLNHHKKTHGPPRKESVCEVCGKEFTRKALWTHMKIHNKQLRCSECGQLFATSGTLKNHIARKHFNTKQHICDICQRAFSVKGELKRHKKLVHEDVNKEQLECKQCLKKFFRSSSLKYHERCHSENPSNGCHLCPKTFSSSKALSEHLQSHASDKPYFCSQCNANFRCKSSLNRHSNKKHRDKKPSQSEQQHISDQLFVAEEQQPISVALSDQQQFNIQIFIPSSDQP
ncbi:RB-associated KRAB zinc finger protein-like [Neocloeon triangulifer]|uniref:RB-associated KRAB zinc finger protein-like n=1 Tax=Neocloeon triangulifer TaxID=2078957 RepID=UPI00286F792C|nr:RB-associated KRAB zinc finger protein-like [Neocloeon triangulifer]